MPFLKESALDLLRAARAQDRLAHAYLISGPAGAGKSWLADRLAAMALDCDPASVHAHPDAHWVQPESKSRRIVIDQIRSLERAIQRKPLVGSTKVAVIRDADRLQPQAANAFLKTLEEPPAGSLILLLSSVPEAMLETVLSRCIDTPLLGSAAQVVIPEDATLLDALAEALTRNSPPGVADAFRFTRAVQQSLAAIRERIASANLATLREEAAKYKNLTDSSAWLDEREEQIKALAETVALRERERLLLVIDDALGTALRIQHGHPGGHPVSAALATAESTRTLLARIDALARLRRSLAAGVQEALALEAGFLDMILLPLHRA